jgi:magnesium transporter
MADAPDNTPPVAPASAVTPLDPTELQDAWALLLPDERLEYLMSLPRPAAEDLFLALPSSDQLEVLTQMPGADRRSWIRLLPADDVCEVVREAPDESRQSLLDLLDVQTLREVQAVLAFREDEAGGLMNPRYAALRPDMTVYEAISYLRRAAGHVETIYYSYVLDPEQRLLGVVSLSELFRVADQSTRIRGVMRTQFASVREDTPDEEAGRILADQDVLALPVLDEQGRMKGILTVDDLVDVIREAATEDMQKAAGMEALDAPYMKIAFWPMIKKRAPWLCVLLVGGMLTATAIAHYEDEIARAAVLVGFMPMILSSGGNAGSQASMLCVRALATGDVRLRDWARIFRKELAVGLVLGCILAAIGMLRIAGWQTAFHSYGGHWMLLGLTVSLALVGVVVLGTLVGSMLPLVLRKIGLDPAVASAPFVATLVDVSGLVIYFTIANLVLRGTLL